MLNTKTMLSNISKGQSAIPLKYIVAGLEQEYNILKNTTILSYVDNSNINEKVIMYYKSPSTTFPQLMYDVVFEFYNKGFDKITTNTEFKVYCNSPSFYFRYANLFRRYGSLLFTNKYPSMVDVPAEIRNSAQVTGFDKYVYACLRLSMNDTIDDLIKSMKDRSAPKVSTFNEKRFEYLKLKKLKQIENDRLVD